MTLRVLLVHSEVEGTRILTRFFQERGDETWHTGQVDEAVSLFDLVDPDLLVLDIHFPGSEWLDLLRQVRQQKPEVKIIITNKIPDLTREVMAQNLGARVFLRQPFTRKWLERAVERVFHQDEAQEPKKSEPEPRYPFYFKVFLPYFLIAILTAVLVAFVSFSYFKTLNRQGEQEHILANVHAVEYFLVSEKHALEQSLNSLAGFLPFSVDDEALSAQLAKSMSSGEFDSIELLNRHGDTVFSARELDGQVVIGTGETHFRQVDFIRRAILTPSVSAGQVSGMVQAPWGDYYYAGRLLFEDGQFQGILLAGKSWQTISAQFAQSSQKEIIIYDLSGRTLETTLPVDVMDLTIPYPLVKEVLESGPGNYQAREISMQEKTYLEVFIPWKVANGDTVALLGLVQLYEVQHILDGAYFLWVLLILLVSAALVTLFAWMLGRRVKTAVADYGRAAREIARGNLEVKISGEADDELDHLAYHFNTMVTGIQERLLEHDLFGVSNAFDPAESLATHSIERLRLEGRVFACTVMRIQPAAFSERMAIDGPRQAFAALNDYFQVMVETALAYGGGMTHFDQEALLVYFGLFNNTMPAEGVRNACHAAQKMHLAARALSQEREEADLARLNFILMIDHQDAAAGALHLKDRLHYAITGPFIEPEKEQYSSRVQEGEDLILVTPGIINMLSEMGEEIEFSPLSSPVEGKSVKQTLFRLD